MTTELGLMDKFKAANFPMRSEPSLDVASLARDYDKIWLPKAPAIADLRKVGASL